MWDYRCCYDFSQHLKGFSTDNWATVTRQQFPKPLRVGLSTSVNINRQKLSGTKTIIAQEQVKVNLMDVQCWDVLHMVARVSPIVGESRRSGWLPVHVSHPHRVVLWSHLQYDGHLESRGSNKVQGLKAQGSMLCRTLSNRLSCQNLFKCFRENIFLWANPESTLSLVPSTKSL